MMRVKIMVVAEDFRVAIRCFSKVRKEGRYVDPFIAFLDRVVGGPLVDASCLTCDPADRVRLKAWRISDPTNDPLCGVTSVESVPSTKPLLYARKSDRCKAIQGGNHNGGITGNWARRRPSEPERQGHMASKVQKRRVVVDRLSPFIPVCTESSS